ncbi:MAG: protein kinase [Gemmataceae bacterium]|nr:protein kinase [Gemmataceae bacterium]
MNPTSLSHDHPGPDELQRFLVGNLAEEELERLAAHIEACSACQRGLSHHVPHDSLVDALRRIPEPDPYTGEPQCTQLIESMAQSFLAWLDPDRPPSAAATPDASSSSDAAAPALTTPAVIDSVLGSLPRRFGRYQVLERLGQGGMGTVYRARDCTLDRPVALKISRFLDRADRHAVERFLREARTAAGLQHEGICRVLDYGEVEGTHYITMEYIQGRSLAQLLNTGQPLEQRRVAALVRQVALALEVAHRQGVIHRDLKPANIMLDDRDQPKVVDFGLARREQDPSLTRTGMALGTPAYMSPEQVNAQPTTPSTDIYSLGVILYELVAGRPPFTGTSWSQFVYQIVHQAPVPPSVHRPGLDPRLEAICLKAIAKASPDRYAMMGELAAALQAYLSSHDTAWQPAPGAGGPVLAQPGPSLTERLWRPVQAALTARPGQAAAALLVVLGLALIWYGAARPPAASEIPVRQTNAGATEINPAFKGRIDVRVWEPGNDQRRNLRLRDFGALPLKPKDQIRIEAQVNRPAYLYVLWIDAAGKVSPVYPWKPGRWEERPADERPTTELSLPEEANVGWEIDEGPAGMETLLLLVRESPWPRAVDLQALVSGLPPQRRQHPQAAVWFENGAVVLNEAERGPSFFVTKEIDDPVLQTQQLLKGKLQPYCSYSRAVSFANQGK